MGLISNRSAKTCQRIIAHNNSMAFDRCLIKDYLLMQLKTESVQCISIAYSKVRIGQYRQESRVTWQGKHAQPIGLCVHLKFVDVHQNCRSVHDQAARRI